MLRAEPRALPGIRIAHGVLSLMLGFTACSNDTAAGGPRRGAADSARTSTARGPAMSPAQPAPASVDSGFVRTDSIRQRAADTVITLTLTGGASHTLRGSPYVFVGRAAPMRRGGGVFVLRESDDAYDPFARVLVLDAATGASTEPTGLLGMPAIAPDGSRLAVIQAFDHGGYQVDIWRFDADSVAKELGLEMPGDVYTPVPEMRWVGNAMIEVFRPDSGTVEERLVRRGSKWDFGKVLR